MCDILKEHDLSEFVDVGVYADDVRISAFGRNSIEAAGRLSSVLLQVALWARKNRVRFDVGSKKCGYMLFANRKQRE